MPVSGDFYTFTKENVGNVTTQAGVYSLHVGERTIYIGKGEGENGIRARLQSHLNGYDGPCTSKATHYKREVCGNPKEREASLLLEYSWSHGGKRPECNDVMPQG